MAQINIATAAAEEAQDLKTRSEITAALSASVELTTSSFGLWFRLVELDPSVFCSVDFDALAVRVIAGCDAQVLEGLVRVCEALPQDQSGMVLDACLEALPTANGHLVGFMFFFRLQVCYYLSIGFLLVVSFLFFYKYTFNFYLL
jgi:hypothetical protein